MNFRTTSFSIASRTIQFSARHNSDIVKYQEQISSGLRLQKPSDDPIAFRHVTSLTSRLTELAADRQSLNGVKSILNTSSVQLQEFNNLFTRAKVIAQQGIQSIDEGEREALAVEVDGLLTQLKNISRTKFDGAYLFSGTRSNVEPFAFGPLAAEGQGISITYNGSVRNSRAYIGESVSVDTYYSGLEIFTRNERQDTILFGNTGIELGDGTDTLQGRANLEISHDETSYLGASGLQPGTQSTEDTIVGSAGTHSITIVDTAGNGSAGTISLNGGEPVPFTDLDQDLKVEGSPGEFVYVDTTNITAGFNGTIDVEATGFLSVDGGASQTPIDFSANQSVIDSNTGNFVTLNTINVFKVGSNRLEFPGTSNAFEVLYELTEDLRNTREFSNQEIATALDRRLGELDAFSGQALHYLGEQATSLSALETLQFRIEDLELSVESQLSDLQATNIPEAVLRLENSQALLQYTYSVSARISSLGLLDFLR